MDERQTGSTHEVAVQHQPLDKRAGTISIGDPESSSVLLVRYPVPLEVDRLTVCVQTLGYGDQTM